MCTLGTHICYLRGTENLKSSLIKYSDADLGGHVDTGHSTSVICIHNGGPILWISQRQKSDVYLQQSRTSCGEQSHS